jgi:alanine racemase
MEKKKRLGLRTWIEIDKKAIKHNHSVFRSVIPKKTKMMAVVKSNAYGHNLTEFALEQEKLGVDYLAVDSAVEGVALRKSGVKIPILVLGYTLPAMIPVALKNNLEITVSSFDYFKEIKKLKLAKPLKIHIKVDTGMHRHGFQIEDMKKVINEIKKLDNRPVHQIVGLYTHFASAKNPAFPHYTKKQMSSFNIWREAFESAGLKPLVHTSATSSTILFPETCLDMVRIGIGLYGLWPSPETMSFAKHKISLQPVLSWKTIIGEIKEVKKGEKIGYDSTEVLRRDSRIAILPIGYWHGYPRDLSSIGEVLVKGQKARVLGRVCMDIMMVDITNIKGVKIGDEVTIIGQDGGESISADDIARLLSISHYELITRINPLIKRIFK